MDQNTPQIPGSPQQASGAPNVQEPNQMTGTMNPQQPGSFPQQASGAPVKAKKPIYKKWWFWVIVVIVVLAVGGGAGSGSGQGDSSSSQSGSASVSQEQPSWDAESDLKGLTVEAAWDEIESNGYTLEKILSPTGYELNSDERVRHSSSAQSWFVTDVQQNDTEKTITISIDAPVTDDEAALEEQKNESVPTEYSNALRQAETYSSVMHMSKKGIYDQLTSEYGGQFSAEAAQYAVDNVKADWNANALAKARSYQDTLAMSPAAIHDQLTSEYGEQFTQEEADYAIANL